MSNKSQFDIEEIYARMRNQIPLRIVVIHGNTFGDWLCGSDCIVCGVAGRGSDGARGDELRGWNLPSGRYCLIGVSTAHERPSHRQRQPSTPLNSFTSNLEYPQLHIIKRSGEIRTPGR